MNVSITLSPALTAWAKGQSDLQGEITKVLEAHLATIDNAMIRAAKLLKSNVPNLPQNMHFEIPQIIGRDDWEAMSRSERLMLGKEVKRDPAVYGLEFLHKSTANHAVYQRLA